MNERTLSLVPQDQERSLLVEMLEEVSGEHVAIAIETVSFLTRSVDQLMMLLMIAVVVEVVL